VSHVTSDVVAYVFFVQVILTESCEKHISMRMLLLVVIHILLQAFNHFLQIALIFESSVGLEICSV
jgi:hypothetical protein